MTPPEVSVGPGPFLSISAVVAVVIVLFFAFWVLGGSNFFIPAEKIRRHRDLLVPTLWIVAVMLLAFGVVYFAAWFEDARQDAAWERYDRWYLQQQTGEDGA